MRSQQIGGEQNLTRREKQILSKVREAGALLGPELPIKLDRDGEDLSPELEKLCRLRLVEVRTIERHGCSISVYRAARA
jgi:hypothetical protein